ncbi:AEC family transporter [Dactylococcopsis salina]|uniref:Permease n=1 Tax=Dactylococcopsis salina (strain PCC 8305) TaxID=13035 RepID=K9YR29_DACS8|nr:AEC family transporter [Dactylococcopsis salina]AFZ49359.1 putative permease [Dactylococcopsis salina PCC 8305]
MTVLLPAIIPVALIIFIGAIGQRYLSLDQATLSQLALYILIPALVGDKLYRTTIAPQGALGLVAGFIITSGLLYLLVLGINRLGNLSETVGKSLIATTMFGNVGNLGLPLNSFAFGEAGLERAIICLITSAILLFGVIPALLKGNGWKYGVVMTLKLPLFWAMIAGIVFHLLNVEFPYRLDAGIEQLGKASIPIALIILGMQLASTRFTVGKYQLFASVLRLIIAPAIALFVGIMLNLTGLDLKVLVLQTAMPAAVNTVLMVGEFGGEPDRAAKTVVVSTVLSFISLPAVLWILTNFQPLPTN